LKVALACLFFGLGTRLDGGSFRSTHDFGQEPHAALGLVDPVLDQVGVEISLTDLIAVPPILRARSATSSVTDFAGPSSRLRW
jgi:hypothetical protein